MSIDLEPGHPYLPAPVAGWQDGAAVFVWRRDRMELLLALRSPSPDDVEEVRQLPVFIGVATIRSVVYLTYQLHDRIGAAPYSIHLLPSVDRPDLAPPADADGTLFDLGLVDAGNGIVRVLRRLLLSSTVERALFSAVARQAARTWDANEYNRDLVELPLWGWGARELHRLAVVGEAVDWADWA